MQVSYVLDTEDVFCRRRVPVQPAVISRGADLRKGRFQSWLHSAPKQAPAAAAPAPMSGAALMNALMA